MRVAVIGAGISGLVCADLLRERFDVTVFEAARSIGGHTRTVGVRHEGADWQVDTGFIVFNERNYPNFCAMLARLGVESIPTSMSFGVRCDRTGLEYGGGSVGSLFAQRRNLVRPRFYRMLRDLLRFGRQSPGDVGRYGDASIGQYALARRYSHEFIELYLVPMAAAIWSSSAQGVRELPMRFLVRFFEHHGMLLPGDRPQWRVIKGGSARYVEKLVAPFRGRIRTGAPVARVVREAEGVRVRVAGEPEEAFDHVVFASHSDQSLAMLGDATTSEREVLGAIGYRANATVLHTDERVLPRRRRAWSSWNYHVQRGEQDRPVVTYNMSMLQRLATRSPVCVTLNSGEGIDPSRRIGAHEFMHPAFTRGALAAQQRHGEISGVRSAGGGRTHYCGAYWGNGFHEDGVRSALEVCRGMGVAT